nr:SHOCT domain-containing protein [Bacillus cereus]
MEHIATSIYHTMFQNVFYTHLMKQNQLVNKIKWVEKYEPGILSVSPRGHWVDVKLQWNEKQKSYSKPSWYGSPEESWYVNSIQPNDHSSTTNPVNSYSVADEIIKLAALKDQGILTEEEFTVKKKQLLGI